nr:uncharacterized protein LOC126534751 [Dermacentor andersoni]
MCSVFTQQTSLPYVAEAVVPVAVVPAPVAVKMQCRPPPQKSRESRRARTKSLESVLVRLDDPWQPESSTVMKTRLLTSVSEESRPDVGIGPSKAVSASSVERGSSHRFADPIVIRLFPASGKTRPATTATESKTTEARTAFCRCACGERREIPTTSTGTDTETDQAEVKRQGSRICTGGAGPVEKQAATAAVFSEPPVGKSHPQKKVNGNLRCGKPTHKFTPRQTPE